MMGNGAGRSSMSGVQLLGALAAILCATAVMPPAAAWSLNQVRVAQTQERADLATSRLRGRTDESTGVVTGAGVVCGPGRLPDLLPSTMTARAAASLPAHRAWLSQARLAPDWFGPGMPTDAWGRCFLVNVEVPTSSGPVWLLSAGPNGLIDTLPNALALGGDDIGRRLR